MARDGAGNFVMPFPDFVAGTTIESSQVDANNADITAGLTGSLARDGQTIPTANLPMGGFKHTGVAVASSRTDYARTDQVIGSVLDYAADTGTATAYAIAPSPGIAAYVVGQRFAFKATSANSGADPTLAVNSLTAGIIYWPDGSSLAASDIAASAQIVVQVATVTTGTPTFHLQTGGNVSATQSPGNNTRKNATTAFVTAAIAANQAWETGDYRISSRASTALTGWVKVDDGTIGNAASGATTRANADTVALFTHLYDTFSNSICPVSGGRGANAAADYAANKTITLSAMLGRALVVAGTGSGLTARALGDKVGAETHTHTGTTGPDGGFVGVQTGGFNVAIDDHTHAFTTDAGASMQPSTFINVFMRL